MWVPAKARAMHGQEHQPIEWQYTIGACMGARSDSAKRILAFNYNSRSCKGLQDLYIVEVRIVRGADREGPDVRTIII